MKIVKAGYEFLTDINRPNVLRQIEKVGRICSDDDDDITKESAEAFVKVMMIRNKSVLEHCSFSVKFVCSVGTSFDLIQDIDVFFICENIKQYEELVFIKPCFMDEMTSKYGLWKDAMRSIETSYFNLLKVGVTPEEAYCILPNSLKTEIMLTMNMSEWRNFIRLRTALDVNSQTREVVVPLYEELRIKFPEIFK